jgi:hypothetical protein
MAQDKKSILANSGDLIASFNRIVRGSALAGEERIELSTHFLVAIADLLQYVPKPRGRQPIRVHDRVHEAVEIGAARRRKAKLIAGGMSKGKATDQAAEEATAKLRKTRNLSIQTIKRRMQKRR